MGYWDKSGGYVYDDSDIAVREAMNETQGQYHDRVQRAGEAARRYEEEEKRRREAEREFEANVRADMRSWEQQRNEEYANQLREMSERQEKEENKRRYGVDYSLRNPKTLSDRRARANFWRLNNNFKLLLAIITGKDKKFSKLWDDYSKAQTDEERERIVEKMEKLYPTRERAIRSVERKQGYSR